jgi:hypothetical protein
MTDRLPDSLIARIRARLCDDWRRTGEGDWLRTPRDRRRKDERATGTASLLGAILDRAAAASPAPLKPIDRLDDAEISRVEKSLGFEVPGPLRDLIVRVGDGNFGPFNGIRRLANWAKDYRTLRSELPAERNREWPSALLPIVYLNGKRLCLDRQSGAVVLWTKPPKKASEKKWLASFVPQSPSLEDWLDRWIDTPTECEGGPPGGWRAPESEVARRDDVAREQAERQAAAVQRATTFTMAAHPPLDDTLVARLRARAMDPERRTSASGLDDTATPVDLDAASRAVRDTDAIDDVTRAQLGALAERAGTLSRLLGGLGVSAIRRRGPGFMMRVGGGGRRGAPLEEADVVRADERLGFRLPTPLRQLYAIADGGFGPGDDGLWPLDRSVATYRGFVSAPQGPNDEPWPARYLPLAAADPATYCLDLQSGAVISHDVQEMDHLGRGQWARSFKREADTLHDWLEGWLGSPTLKQSLDRELHLAMAQASSRPPSPVTGYPMQLDAAQQAEAEITFLSHADPGLRRSFGLPDVGWEDEVRRRHGLIG